MHCPHLLCLRHKRPLLVQRVSCPLVLLLQNRDRQAHRRSPPVQNGAIRDTLSRHHTASAMAAFH